MDSLIILNLIYKLNGVKNSTNKVPAYAKPALVLLTLYLIVSGLIVTKPLLIPLAFAALLAALLTPMANLLEKFRFPRMLSTIVSIIIAVIVLLGLLFFLYRQIMVFVNELPLVGERISEILKDFSSALFQRTGIEIDLEIESVKTSLIQYIQKNSQSVTLIALNVLGSLTSLFLIPVYLFLLLLYRDFLEEFFIKAAANNGQANVRKIILKVKVVSQKYVSGMFIVFIILSILNAIALISLDIDHAIFFAVFAGALNIVPYIGPIVGSIIPVIYAFITKDSLFPGFAVLIYFYVVQLIESYFFIPAIVGRHVDMNPLIVILALFIGYYVWGVPGMILVIPIFGMLKKVFDEIEPLKPYGFLIGGVPDTDTKQLKIIEKVRKLKQKLKIG
jgi:predicted PurR-regulated permease PerM